MRCRQEREGNRILRFTVQLELWVDEAWIPALRYDNAHGYCHRDTIHADGAEEKTPIAVGNNNQTFTWVIADVRTNWIKYEERYQRELCHDST